MSDTQTPFPLTDGSSSPVAGNLSADAMSTSSELLLLRRKRLELKSRKLDIIRGFGLLQYQPHPKQVKFHSSANFKRRLLRAGNRFGKSLMGCAEDCSHLLGERPWITKGDPLRVLGIKTPPNKGLVITTDFDKVDEVWTSQKGSPGKLWQLLPKDGFVKSVQRNSSGVIDTVYCSNGSILRFDTVKSWQNNPQSSESSDYDFIHIDEPCPEKMWVAASRGLVDRGGPAWFTLTPLKEVWINDMFFPRRYKESADQEIVKGSRWAMQGSMHDNPHLTKEAIAEFESSLTEDEKQCRIHGLPLDLSGMIYKEFDFDRHVLQKLPEGWKSFARCPDNYTVYYSIDPHPQTPHAVLFCGVSPHGQKFFWSEIFAQTTINKLSRFILDKISGLYVYSAKCDPLAYINDPITGSNMEEEFANHGVFVEKATKALAMGILKVKEELQKENNLYFSPELEETLWEFERYVWDEKTNKPIDRDDHMMENLYRILLENPRYIDRKNVTNRPVEEEEIPSNAASTKLEDVGFSLE